MTDLISLEKIAQWQKLKTLVLDSVSSPITKRVYNMALDEFMGWFQQAPRPGFTKATVSAWRVSLEDRGHADLSHYRWLSWIDIQKFREEFLEIFKRGKRCDEGCRKGPAVGSRGALGDLLQGLPQGLLFNLMRFAG